MISGEYRNLNLFSHYFKSSFESVLRFSFTSAILSVYSNLLFVLFHLDRSFRKLSLNTINQIFVGMISYLLVILFV
jgi:H+/Cl- antiporter ClcA